MLFPQNLGRLPTAVDACTDMPSGMHICAVTRKQSTNGYVGQVLSDVFRLAIWEGSHLDKAVYPLV